MVALSTLALLYLLGHVGHLLSLSFHIDPPYSRHAFHRVVLHVFISLSWNRLGELAFLLALLFPSELCEVLRFVAFRCVLFPTFVLP